MTGKEAIEYVIKLLEESTLFKCPESNNIADHNKKILDLLKNSICDVVPEDEIPWDTSANVLESSIITDFND